MPPRDSCRLIDHLRLPTQQHKAIMCGIAGRFSWDKQPKGDVIHRMIQRLAHRGPDAHGHYLDGCIGLGHCRLAIIDPQENSNQPMFDGSGGFIIVYNGEIYNYQEIRNTLIEGGAVFRTHSDTEVILESYKRWGVACLERFNGMFALAIWDSHAKKLFLARDRLGKKPLFYHLLPSGGLIFASELKALMADPDVPYRINPAAVSHYLSLNYTLSAAAILQDVQKLAAGHYLLISQNKQAEVHSYWNLAHHFHNKQCYQSEEEATEAFLALFDDAVKLRLISDVPLGAFLSGGLDSSAIAATMARLGDPRQVQTFSIGFPEKSYSELNKARLVADYLQVLHKDRVVDATFMDNFSDLAYYADEPFADTSIIPMLHLSAFARNDVTVALSGDGADELFAGYVTYSADRIHHLTQWLPDWCMKLAGKCTNLLAVSRNKVSLDYKLRQFLAFHSASPSRAHFGWRTIFSEADKKALVVPELEQEIGANDPFAHFSNYFNDVKDCHYLDQAMYVDMKTWLVDDILVKVDRASMAHGLEARAPFLDYRLVEFAASLPVNLKMKGFTKKYLLKKGLKDRLPASILHQRKEGFNAPVASWLADCERSMIAEVKNRPLGKGIFKEASVALLWDEHLQKKRDNGLRLFGLIMFDAWQNHPVFKG